MEKIRVALRSWGKSEEIVSGFTGSRLHDYFGTWSQFVDTDWSDWDRAEYNHDIGCRYWIQLAIENSSSDTSENLQQAVQPVDERFKARMKPCQDTTQLMLKGPFLDHPYFWETHTIHPELMLNNENEKSI